MPLNAQGAQHQLRQLYPYGYEAISVGAAALGLWQTVQSDPGDTGVHIQVENGPGRGRVDGGLPAAGGPGFPLYDIDSFFLSTQEAYKFKAIRDGATNVLLHVTYYRKI